MIFLYIVTLAIALVVAGTVQARQQFIPNTTTPTTTKLVSPPSPPQPSKSSKSKSYIDPTVLIALNELNDIRIAKKLLPLCLNLNLQSSAQEHSNNMARTGKMEHAPDTFQRMERFGYPSNTPRAENIAVNQDGVIDSNCFNNEGPKVTDYSTSATYTTNCAWYKSSGHLKNMLDPTFTQVGIAYTVGNWAGRKSYFWTQNFGRSDLPCITSNNKDTKSYGNSNSTPTIVSNLKPIRRIIKYKVIRKQIKP